MASNKQTRKDTDSPCIGTCSTLSGDEICVGCYRTFDEILLWHKFSDDEKRIINKRIEENNDSSS